MKKRLFVFLAVTLFALDAGAQVVIAPPIVYISDQLPYGTFVVSNVSTVPQEVDISFKFGYPNTDKAGDIYMDYKDTTAETKFSCASWLTAFPTKFILNPGQEQVVHMSVSAPDSLRDGVYWSRLVTVSQPQQKFVDTVRAGISANIIFVFRQITSVLFEKGALKAGVDVEGLHASQDSASEDVYASLTRTGNAPFLGTVSVSVSNGAGNVVYAKESLIAVYMSFIKKFSIPLDKLTPGIYTATVRLTSERDDIPPEHQLKSPPVSKTFSFTVK